MANLIPQQFEIPFFQVILCLDDVQEWDPNELYTLLFGTLFKAALKYNSTIFFENFLFMNKNLMSKFLYEKRKFSKNIM